jgi:hypothetical protein
LRRERERERERERALWKKFDTDFKYPIEGGRAGRGRGGEWTSDKICSG